MDGGPLHRDRTEAVPVRVVAAVGTEGEVLREAEVAHLGGCAALRIAGQQPHRRLRALLQFHQEFCGAFEDPSREIAVR